MRKYVATFSALAAALLLPGPARASEPIRIASYNIRAAVTTAEFAAAVTALSERTDVMALQELNRKEKEAVLAGLNGWSYFRGKGAEDNLVQVPVVWRSDRFELAGGRIERISRERFIGGELRNWGPTAAARYATVVRLVDRRDGRRISIVNGHTVPGACSNGRKVKSRPRLFKKYAEEVRTLAALGSIETAAWGTAFVTGDLNCGYVADRKRHKKKLPFRTFRSAGLLSMWETEQPPEKHGSRGQSLLDNVYAPVPAVSSQVQFDLTWSDHHPVIATYL